MNNITVRQGTTNGITLYLLADNVAIDLSTAEKVLLILKSNDGISTSHDSDTGTSGCVITTAVSGIITFYPYSTTYTTSRVLKASESPYKLYVWVYPNASPDATKYSVPETNEITLNVRNE